MEKMKGDLFSLVPLLEMAREAELHKLATINRDIGSLEQELRSLRADVRFTAQNASDCYGVEIQSRDRWVAWVENRCQALSSDLANLAAARETQKATLSIAIGRAEVATELEKNIGKSARK